MNRLEELTKDLNMKDIFGNILNKNSSFKDIIRNLVSKKKEKIEGEVYILVKAMVNAAKSDHKIDADEQKKIMEFMGKMSDKERLFLEKEMSKSLNLKTFLKEIPKGMEQQVYYMSLFAIDLDIESEVLYLESLAKGLGLSSEIVDDIHQQLALVETV